MSFHIKTLTTIFFLIFLVESVFGQKGKEDDLDSFQLRIDDYYRLTNEYLKKHPKASHIQYIDSLLKVSISKKKGKLDSVALLQVKEVYLFESADFEKAEKLLEILILPNNSKYFKASLYCENLTWLFQINLKYDRNEKAYSYYIKLMDKISSLKEEEKTISMYNQLGLAMYENFYYKDAMFLFQQSLKKINGKKVDQFLKYWRAQENYSNVGLCYYKLGDYRKSLEYYDKALKVIRDTSIVGNGKTLFYGEPYYVYKDYPFAYINVCDNISKSFFAMHEYDNATQVLENAMNQFKGLKYINFEQLESSSFQLFRCYTYKKEISKAKKMYPLILNYYRGLKNELILKSNYYNKCISEYHFLIGNIDSGLFYQQKVDITNLEELKHRHSSNMIERYTQYQYTKDKENLNKLEKEYEKKSKTNTILYGLIVLIILSNIIILILFINIRHTNKESVILNKSLNDNNDKINTINNRLENLLSEREHLFKVVAHDLRAPIANIKTLVELIHDEPSIEEFNQYYDMMNISCDNAFSIIDSLLSVAENENIGLSDISEFNILQAIEEVVLFFTLKLNSKNLEFILKPNAKNYVILGDRKSIIRAIGNLLSNAIKFTHRNGRIIIELTNDFEHNTIIIKIIDSGIGIPDHLKPFIFDRFTKAGRRGTDGEKSIGLGMDIVKRIIELHKGGKIEFSSIEKEGTTFTVTLPIVEE